MPDDNDAGFLSRRSLLRSGLAGGSVAVAGCGGGDGGGGGGDGSGDGGGDSGGGSTGDGDGGSPEHGPPVETIQVASPDWLNYVPITRSLTRMWSEALGVQFSINSQSFSSYLGEIYGQGNFEHMAVYTLGGTPSRLDVQVLLATVTSEAPLNHSNYQNGSYDETFNELSTTFDEATRDELVGELQTAWFEDLPRISFYRQMETAPVNTGLWEIEPTPFVGANVQGSVAIIDAEPKGDARTLVMGGTATYSSPNPLAPVGVPQQFLFKLPYDTLKRFSPDGEFVNWAVEEFAVQDDTTVDLHLRDGMTFHDGEAVTAEDLKFTLDLLTEYSFPKFDPYVSSVESTSIQGDGVVRVNFTQPDPVFLTASAVFIQILPQHIWERAPEEADKPVEWSTSVDDLVASGPFQVESVANDRVEFSTFDDHWAAPNYDGFIYASVGSQEAIRAGFANGEIHMVFTGPSPSQAEQMAQPADVEVFTTAGLDTGEYIWKLDSQPFDDPAMRKAIRYATNVEELVEVHLDGRAHIPDGTIVHPELDVGRNDLATLAETYDPEKARMTLEEAGYTWDSDGRLHYPAE